MLTTKDIQAALVAAGYSLEVDGVFGRMTRDTVKAFQQAHGLVVDGIVGPKTTRALRDAPAVGGKAKPELKGLPMPPWLSEAERKMGLHEVTDNVELKAFLASDGHALGDPAKLPWCFAGETEILTIDGWQRFDALTAPQVAQVDENGGVEFTGYLPVRKPYDGDAFHVQGSSVNLICDIGHRWWGVWGATGRDRRADAPRFGTLDEIPYDGLTMAAPHSLGDGVAMSDDEIRIVAAFVSDGTRKNGKGPVVFEVSKERKVMALRELSPAHVYTQAKAYGPRTKTPLTVFTFDVPTCFDFALDGYKGLSRAFVAGMSQRQRRIFVDAYATFDGSVRPDGRITLYTSDPALRDDLITIIYLAGYWPRLEPGGRSDLTRKPSWRVGFAPTEGLRKRIVANDVERVPFSGEMFCVTVPKGRIIVRGSNMLPCVTGNCGDFIETCIALTVPDERMVTNPYYALNWLKFGVPLDEARPLLGAVGVIKREGGGHVFFVAGHDRDYWHALGGNQGNRVSIMKVSKDRTEGLRWPSGYPLPEGYREGGKDGVLKFSTFDGAISTNEA